MALIFPDTPLQSTTPEVARVHRVLKSLPDEFTIWHRLTIHSTPGPDFWILSSEGRSLWLKVSSLTVAQASAFGQNDLFGGSSTESSLRPGFAEHHALRAFASANLPSDATVPAAVLFAGLNDEDLSRLTSLADNPADILWLSNKILKGQALREWLVEHLGPRLSPDVHLQLRQAFTPEVVIPPSFTVRSTNGASRRKTTAALTPFLLDYEQEQVLKTDLELSDEAKASVGDFKVRLINGVAGSGKSLVVVYRAQLLRKLNPNKTTLGLTHNKALIRDLRARAIALGGPGHNGDWQTFNQLCFRLWPSSAGPYPSPIKRPLKSRLIKEVCDTEYANDPFLAAHFEDELDWYKDRVIYSRDTYLAADRTGRGFALSEAQRNRLYSGFEAFQEAIRRLPLLEGNRPQREWADIPRHLWRLIRQGSVPLPEYDAVLIDEAQFFAPIWFEIIKRIVKPRTGHLFLVADPTQGFLKRRQSWLACGLEVRGRAHTLKHSYRTTREILSFATLLYRTRLPADDDDIVVPDLFNMPTGLVPQLIRLTSSQDEISRVVSEVDQLVRQGVPPRHILVIQADPRANYQLMSRLRATLGPEAVIDPRVAESNNAVRVCALNAATGLESPIVFLVGVHALFEQEQSVRLSDDERHDLVRDNTRRLYMALTRAGQRVVLTYVGEPPAAMLQSLESPQP